MASRVTPRLVFGALALVWASPASAQVWGWLRRDVFDRIQLSGYRNLGFHSHKVDGDREAFNSLNYGGQGNRRFTDQGTVDVVGDKVFGLFNFRATITDSRFQDPQQQRFSLDYAKKAWSVNAGDIYGALLNTNPYASVSRSMRGGMAQFSSGGLTLKALRSEARGSARTVSLEGNNSVGPYYLQSNQIVADSEQVLVDGVEQTLGRDYVINYEVGYITFLTKVIAPTSSIVVSYEAFGFNATPGVIQGLGATYRIPKNGGLVGLTLLEQKARGGSSLSTRLEQFQGFGAASTPYFLQFEPLRTRPIAVKVDGVIQVEGVDFYFDAINPVVFYFTRTIPASSNVDVVYTPKPTQTVNGDRRTVGFDYRLPVGRYGSVHYAQATGELLSEVNPFKGTAKGLTASLNYKGYRLTGGVTDIPDTYVAVETRGFQRNERNTRLQIERESGLIRYGAAYTNARIAQRLVDDNGNVTFRPSRTTQLRAHAETNVLTGTRWSLEHTRQTAKNSSFDNRLDTTRTSLSRTWSKLSGQFGAEHQSGRGLVGATPSNIGINSLFTRLDYVPRDDLSLSSKLSFSNVRSGTNRGSGRDITLSSTYRPSDRLNLQASYLDSDSGALASLSGFSLGNGLGYDGNGFSGGAGNPSFNAGAISQRAFRLAAQSQLSPRLSVDARGYLVRAFGGVTSNSDTTGVGLGVDYDFGNQTRLNLNLDQTNTKFLGTAVRSESSSISAYLDADPSGPWLYRLSTSALISGGGSTFAQNSLYGDASLSYLLTPRQRLTLAGTAGRTTGYLPQEEYQVSLGYTYQIWRNLGLTASYRIRRITSLDPFQTSGQYRSRGLDFELTFDFGR